MTKVTSPYFNGMDLRPGFRNDSERNNADFDRSAYVQIYSAAFFHFLIFVLKVPNGATVFT